MDSKQHSITELFQNNFIEYASYVIKDRAIPELSDGLKPVQRRILHALFEMDDGKFHKVANVIGASMKYHPHGDASIGDALVVLANKGYFIDRQGNFGNILTGDDASAPRYIECKLSELAKEVLFNKEITEFTDSYDGRNKEPSTLPCKIPYLLLHGSEGVAVGMATKILPHNFNEVLDAQIAYLKGVSFKLYPDFQQGGLIDVSEYQDGAGKIRARAKIDTKGHKILIIRDIPYGVTSEGIMNSIEEAVKKNKVKISSIKDFTTDKIEIELITQKGITADEVLKRLYAYTDCEVSLSSNITVIDDNLPRIMTVSEVLKKSTDHLLEILKAELKIRIKNLSDKLHHKSLEQIFIENKIYRLIENCDHYELVKETVHKALRPHVKKWERPVTEEDVEKLLEMQIKKISKYDLKKNQEEIKEILQQIKTEQGHLNAIKRYAIQLLNGLMKKYGKLYPRKSQITSFDTVNVRELKDRDTRLFYDHKTGYIGTRVRGDAKLDCSSFDKILLISRNGTYQVVPPPEKMYSDKLLYFGIVDKELVFNVLSRDKKSKACYAKRFKIGGFIQGKQYPFLDPDHKVEQFTTRNGMQFEVEYASNIKELNKTDRYSFDDYPVKGPQNRGTRIGTRKIGRLELKSPIEITNQESSVQEEDSSEGPQLELNLGKDSKQQNEPKETIQSRIPVEEDSFLEKLLSAKPNPKKKS
ncbi:MAG: DNA topoisomerase IV subunit A, partial [Candidatus Aureabacteria bacterium]|nr:DNA topoisomerase IV subunit A [Candidatus Auribacterota bacterium]